jgi:P-type Cu2+ transporter
VYDLLRGQGLDRYYALRSGPGLAVADAPRAAGDAAWMAAALQTVDTATGLGRLELDVEGIHCTGCVWLIQEIFRRLHVEGQVVVNPALGTLALSVDGSFPLQAFAEQLRGVGYRLGPHRKDDRRPSDDLLWRIGVCVALAMNAMIFAIARYAGLEGGTLETIFLWLELALATAALVVGGSVFFRAALKGLSRGMVHLDLPITVGLLLGYIGSAASLFADRLNGTYFDTLIVFTTLMLVGRFLRERVLERNRAQLLEDAGIEGLFCRRLEGTKVNVVPVTSIKRGDELLVAPGDVVPVAAVCGGEAASFSFDWVTGESDVRTFTRGQAVSAGAANATQVATRLEASEDFSHSRLLSLLRAPRPAARHGEAPSPFESAIARFWVPGVLLAAAGGFAFRFALGMGAWDGLSVAVAVLVITCPCAFGIATPLAHELVLARLRKEGLLVRSTTFLERALSVRRVVFDKTGTLTNGRLELADNAPLRALPFPDRVALYNLASRSGHPKSAAIKAAIEAEAQRFLDDVDVHEEPGHGLVGIIAGDSYRLGSPSGSGDADVVFSKNGREIASFKTREELRGDAKHEVRALAASGLDIWMSTGDSRERAASTAAEVGIARDHTLAGQTPEDKAAFINATDHADTLMIGDGVNDGPAVQAAHCSGTPAAGRAFLASRADFYLLADGLRPVRMGLQAAKRLRQTLRRSLLWAITYNVAALGLCYAGIMTPLLCAVLMPCSSLISIAMVTTALGKRGESQWRS